ncbi:hypothetical protein FQR65_LT18841 [Abscondita terminalis]|nr:hypothetical protein FQR65_LT18841 [Abscondita terminalis]
MVAGGGASVIYSDTICDLGGAKELANYGEYSGAPSEQQTYEYAKTILSLMTQEKHPDGKVLITGAASPTSRTSPPRFRGIITALQEFQPRLVEHKISIFVRRAGPNYQEGVPMYVFGPETHMTSICGMALGKKPIPIENNITEFATANFLLPGGQVDKVLAFDMSGTTSTYLCNRIEQGDGVTNNVPLFSAKTKAIVWGMQTRAVQSMLDFDFVCRREEPSVVAIVYPFTGDHKQKFYWGHKEVLVPGRLTRDVETMEYPQIRTIAIIAEGIPENMTRKLIKLANEKGVSIIGPATVGGLKPGCFKIGNTGGMMDNILHSKLYRPGSVAYVSRSGGMSNELNNIISKATDGVYEGVAIGGDRYPGTTFMDFIMRRSRWRRRIRSLQGAANEGDHETSRCLVHWDLRRNVPSEVQFGHAGSCAQSNKETANSKNEALKAAGAFVPESFDTLGDVVQNVYQKLVKKGVITPKPEVPPPTVPMDYNWARELGLIRKPASFMTSICDERGQELLYAGMPISDVLNKNVGIGGVISLLWFQRCLPPYVCKFFEMCLMVTADHGPAVSGAHNTIVCARAGKDLVSSLVSGLLTIGDRFGGALDGAARQFSEGYDAGMHPTEFVNQMRNKGQLIMGIGHRVKSINNPDQRVQIIKDYVLETFPANPLLKYALEVEKITTSKNRT